MASRIQPRLQQQLKLLLVAGALAMSGLVALPAADAKAAQCSSAYQCTSNYWSTFPTNKVWVEFDGWDSRWYQVQVWYSGIRAPCEWHVYGNNPPTTLICWSVPPGHTVYATSSTSVPSRHSINIGPAY
jgi:hypothetical protein